MHQGEVSTTMRQRVGQLASTQVSHGIAYDANGLGHIREVK